MNLNFYILVFLFTKTLNFVKGSTIFGGSFIDDMFSNADVLMIKSNFGPKMCVKNCLMVNSCTAVNYIRSEQKCELLHEMFPTNALQTKPGYSYTNMDSWEMVKRCPPDWKQLDANCFWFSNTSKTWSNAKAYCESHNSILAEPKTSAEVDLLRAMAISKKSSTWLGGILESTWIWTSSSNPITTFAWHSKQPSGDGKCLNVHSYLSYWWNDDGCNKSYRFVCEKSCL